MELGMIGLGRMGTKMVRRLRRAGHHCVVCDLGAEAVQALVSEGAVGTKSREGFAEKLLSAMRYEFGGHKEKSAATQGGT